MHEKKNRKYTSYNYFKCTIYLKKNNKTDILLSYEKNLTYIYKLNHQIHIIKIIHINK